MAMAKANQDDLAYVRDLAERGAKAPLIGGRFMVWWGLLITVAYTVHHFALNGRIGDGDTIFGLIWATFGILGAAGQIALARGLRGKAGAGSAGNLASRSVWAASAFSCLSMVVGSAIAAGSGAGPAAFDWIVPVAFTAYACSLIVTGSLAANRIVVTAGVGAIVMVGLFTALILHPDRYLLAALGGALTILLPGLLLVIAEPKSLD